MEDYDKKLIVATVAIISAGLIITSVLLLKMM